LTETGFVGIVASKNVIWQFIKEPCHLKILRTILWTQLLMAVCIPGVYAFDIDWRSAGARAGFSDNRNEESFNQYEAFATVNLPWYWKLGNQWQLGTFLEGNAGALVGGGDTGLVVSLGGGFYLDGFEDTIEISAGFNPTYISQSDYGDEDFGGPIQFTSYLNINFIIKKHFSIGYRLQHMSNAGLYGNNPGVNLHMISLGYRF
jgi:hypothetical protein